MREVRDAAALDRAAGIIGELVRESNAPRNVPGNKPIYFRGALVRKRRP
jgi:hypothetical protein